MQQEGREAVSSGVEERDEREAVDRRIDDRARLRLATIIENSDDAIISGTTEGVVETWNAGAERIFGYSAREMIGASIVEMLPNSSIVAELLSRISAGEVIPRVELQHHRKDGSPIDVSATVSALTDDAGKLVGIAAIAQDVSPRREAERSLAQSRDESRLAFENAPIGMAIVSIEGVVVQANDRLCKFLGRSAEELLTTNFRDITHPEDLTKDLAEFKSLLAGEKAEYELEKRYQRPDGSAVWGLLSVSLVRDSAGKPVHFISQILDITTRKKTEEEVLRSARRLHDLALRDPLTGLRNKGDFRQALGVEIERASRYGRPLSIALFDVDDFSHVNAVRGREHGDRLIREIGDVLVAESRSPDLVARTGPDEFALILPEVDAAGAVAVARRITESTAAFDGSTTAISFGVARWFAGCADADALIAIADRALTLMRPAGGPRALQAKDGLSPRALASVRRMLELARSELGLDLAFLGEFVDGQEVFRVVDGDDGSFGELKENDEVPLAETYCQRMVTGEIGALVPDTAANAILADLGATEAAGIGSYVGMPIRLPGGRIYGALCGLNHEARHDISERDLSLMRVLSHLIEEIIETDRDAQSEREAAIEISGIHALLVALEARDQYTGEHSRTVVNHARRVAEQIGLAETELLASEQVSLLHDIGKVGIPDSILLKQGPLTEAEWELMRQHPAIGERIVANTRSLAHLAPAIRAEHERFDGTGYPDGLKGEEIPIQSRICFACDAFDAMITERPYRKRMTRSAARRELVKNAGSQFDPQVIDALLVAIDSSS